MNQKDILVISNMYPTDKHKSFGIFVKNQVEALSRTGLNVDVMAINDPESGKAKVLKKYLMWLFATAANLLSKGKKYDVVHAHYVFPSGALGLMYKKLWKTKLVVTAHGGDIDKMARKNARLFQWTKKILQEADEVIAVGTELEETIRTEFNVPAEKISLLNMGVDRTVFAPQDASQAKAKLGLPKDENVLLFTGNVIRQKGVKELIEAVGLLKSAGESAKLYIIGPAKDRAFYQELKADIAKFGLEDQVEFAGVKPQKEVALWMAVADVFVLPSHIEGFGLVALEAMSCETPVLGTSVGGLKHLLAGDSGCMVRVQNADDIKKGIQKILSDEDYRSLLINNGIHKAEENDQKYIIEKLLTLYFPTGG
ncbi:glycosyltransferase involved in cell wall biosynthesis [Bacillus ectoiniformans]|uniref:glycosyltransferase n=1 Tax=Bacillus ectoiniformans TaxID=1494429 RepID=UPI001EF7DBBF|nr:glycosyltransferase [Bacillus ectoiniformans]MBM7649335.1 glycosyltransferase involved in cell wall biosynthesis [Bacillus ectoiniformans]